MSNYSTPPTPVHTESGKVVGEVVGDVLRKRVKGKTHQLRRPVRGWGWDVVCLNQAKQLGATRTELHDFINDRVYHAHLEDFDQHGRDVHYPGWGKQRCLPVKYWRISRPGEPPPPRQLSLFGGE